MTDNSELINEINALRQERKAVLLAHNYQRPEVQDIADFTGDSLGLSRQAARAEAEVIVFCGVHFMAQTAKLLSPSKTVLLPEKEAGCPMADMISPEQLREFKAQYPGAPVVAYVNTTAEVKAESDICCTSANAVEVVKSLDADRILFIPDRNLGSWVARAVPDTEILLYPGFCPTHQYITAEDIQKAKQEHPAALVLAHPECAAEVLALADAVRSTSGMLRFARESDASEFIVATEMGLLHPLQKDNPGKTFYPLFSALCPNMKLTTLESIRRALTTNTHVIEIDEGIAGRARATVERMVAIG
ncbi:quinolinate synthase NadA [bacterium]|nr:quinolinate synthase NadA [bacterium]